MKLLQSYKSEMMNFDDNKSGKKWLNSGIHFASGQVRLAIGQDVCDH